MRPTFATLVLAFAALAAAPGAHAATGPCLAGVPGSPTCTVWQAKVAVVDDGDTVQARVQEGKKLSPRHSVRLNGVQAMEIHNYAHGARRSGDCESVQASRRLEQLVQHKWVRLSAQRKSSTTSGEGGRVRLRRSIAVKQHGRWVDVGSLMIAEGWGLPFPNAHEWASNGVYMKLAQEAAARQKNLWNPTACGVGPGAANLFIVKLKWDAEDDDARNINGEWVRITNASPEAVSLHGWWLRDSHFRGPQHGAKKGRGYLFPSGTSVPAWSSIQVHVGRGTNSATDLYWGLTESIFENATNDKKKVGDGAYLFDPKGNLRAYSMYPCRAGNCTDPLAGKVQVEARYMGVENEWVTIHNTSAEPVNLWQYDLESVPWFYEFKPGDVVEPGKSIVVWINKPHAVPIGTPGVKRDFVEPVPGVAPFADAAEFESWNHSDALLGDGKDVVTLRNPNGQPVTCDAWGGAHCPSV